MITCWTGWKRSSLIVKLEGLQKVPCASIAKRSNYFRTTAMPRRSSRSVKSPHLFYVSSCSTWKNPVIMPAGDTPHFERSGLFFCGTKTRWSRRDGPTRSGKWKLPEFHWNLWSRYPSILLARWRRSARMILSLGSGMQPSCFAFWIREPGQTNFFLSIWTISTKLVGTFWSGREKVISRVPSTLANNQSEHSGATWISARMIAMLYG